MRMKQNFVEFVSLTDEAHLLRQQLWKIFKSVLQRRQQSCVRGQRHFRCSRALFEKQVHAGDGPLALCRLDQLSKVAKRILMRVPLLQISLAASMQRAWTEDSTLAKDYLDVSGEISWPDRRSDDCGGLCGVLGRNRKQCTTSTSCTAEPVPVAKNRCDRTNGRRGRD